MRCFQRVRYGVAWGPRWGKEGAGVGVGGGVVVEIGSTTEGAMKRQGRVRMQIAGRQQ